MPCKDGLVRLYHYLGSHWALDNIRRRRLKISQFSDLNDPYELESICSDDHFTQLALNKTKSEFISKYGLVCFSQCWNSVLMWSHYADKHKGMCLGFDVADEVTRPVEYAPKPEIIGNMVFRNEADFPLKKGREIVDRLLEVKYDGWEYEKEVRVHVLHAEKDEETGQYFCDFGDRLILKEIIAGAKFPFSRKVVEDALVGYADIANISIIKVCPCPTKFELVVDEEGFNVFEEQSREQIELQKPQEVRGLSRIVAVGETRRYLVDFFERELQMPIRTKTQEPIRPSQFISDSDEEQL